MAIKVQSKKKTTAKKAAVKKEKQVVAEVQETEQVEQKQGQAPGNLDLWNFLSQMTQMMWQQNEMIKMMDERMKKLEEQNTSTKTQAVQGEVVKDPEVINVVNEWNVASYSREDDEGYAEIVNKVWKILYITAQAPVMRGMQDAAPMMEPVCERRRVWNMVVQDTKYFNSEDDAKAYIENMRKKGITLPGAKIVSCYI